MILLNYGFIKTAAAAPKIRVANCGFNADSIIASVKEAYEHGASVAVFHELCVTGYTCSDLFLQSALLREAEKAVEKIVKETENLNIVFAVGAPIAVKQALYNCAVVICKGRILGAVPKINIPNYGEFYEARHFTSGKDVDEVISFAGQDDVRLCAKMYFSCKSMSDFTFGVEICEDLWVADSPSVNLTKSGALLMLNLSSSDDLIGKAQYRRDLVKMQSAKLCCGYVYCDSGFGESTTDMVFSAHNIISENGTVLSESERFTNGIIYADIDLQRLLGERRKTNTYIGASGNDLCESINFDLKIPDDFKLERNFPRTPFVPYDRGDLEKRCEEILTIQATGLATRLCHTGIKNVVVGLSGGLDSTLALIVCVHAFDMLSLDRKNIYTVTMPCFGTTKRTKSNAQKLAQAYGVSFEEIDITLAVRRHFADISHDESVTDVTYENSQARERTQILMDLSNKYGALVIGTGDLSELALGWATYNGDHMSMYAVNASVPKTLVRYLTSYEAQKSASPLKEVLLDVLDTPVSPELLPPDKNGDIAQKTEDVVGPYELHDYFLYYMVRFGYSPSKIYYIAKQSFYGVYSESTIKKWLIVFIRRFFSQQFKRSCLPDGPKVGSVTLSPRSDWRMPSDADARLWLDEAENA